MPKYSSIYRKLLLSIACTGIANCLFAQSLDALAQEEAVKVSGGVNISSIAYKALGLNARRPPLNWILSGNINFSIYGWDIPFSFSYSNQEVIFRQPFNQYGISPQYKWVKTYLGYHNLSYSSYTLSGHTFLGAAVELTPGKFHFHAMYGRLNKAVDPDTSLISSNIPSFRRMGLAMKAGYHGKYQSIAFSILHAVDDLSSLTIEPDSLIMHFPELKPAENIAFSIDGKTSLTRNINLFTAWGISSLTRDIRATAVEHQSGLVSMGGLLEVRTSTSLHQAFKTGIGYTGKGYGLNFQYERVDPDYETLGAYFFNNDLENLTLGGNLQLFQNKITLNGQSGVQKNNLDNSDIRQTQRFVNNLNLSWLISNQWYLTTTYSNFTSYTNVRPLEDPFFRNDFDSLNFYQINQNASVNTSYQFGPKEKKQAVLLSANYQLVDEKSIASTSSGDTYFYSGNLSYRYSILASNLVFTAGTSFYKNSMGSIESLTIGPVLSASKAFLEKKLRTNLSSSFNQVHTNNDLTSRVVNTRLNGSYIKDNHSFSMNLNSLNKVAVQAEESGFTEFTLTLNYGYTF